MKKPLEEAEAILARMMNALTMRLPGKGRPAAEFRVAMGNLMANLEDRIDDETVGTELLNVFDLAREAGGTLDSFDDVRLAMLDEQAPVYVFGQALVLGGLVFSLTEQCKLLSVMTFVSRDDVQVMIKRMIPVLDTTKLETAERLDGQNYQNVIALSASLMQHLAVTERQLPRLVHFHFPTRLPSLYLSHRLYWVGSRSDEIAAENKTIHPAFVQATVKALSA